MTDITDHDAKEKQKEIVKTAIKKLIDATVDIGVELYFTNKEHTETIQMEEIEHEETRKRDTDSSRKNKKRK